MMKQAAKRLIVLSVFVLATVGARAQEENVPQMAKAAHPSFEVATIKPSSPDDQSSGFHTMGHRLFYENETMNALISFAYSVHSKQIGDAPDWFGKDRYDVKGMPDVEGQPGLQQQREMLQKLLAERFGLKFHREKRDLSIFAVTIAKGGPKLAATKSDPDSLPDQTGNGNAGEQAWKFTNNSLNDFASLMQYFLDRPVVDETGLKGKFDFLLKWTTDSSQNTDPQASPGLFTAIQEQLGLKVEAAKGPAEVLVIEHVQRPSEN
jgi:uncharacterized protein (TIGR03435 family)